MNAAMLAVLKRPQRRTHLVMMGTYNHAAHTIETSCGIVVPALDGTAVDIDCAGGATPRLMQTLRRELDDNTCLRCTRLAGMMLLCYGMRDTGKPML